MSFVGSRCKVCIGCGRCNRMDDKIQVVQDSYFLSSNQKHEGVAVDIGTTTIAIECVDEEGKVVDMYSCVNPQRMFGADVLSRIEKAENRMLLLQMSAMVKREIEQAIAGFRAKGYVPKRGVIAGNTTMMYLLLNHNPEELGRAPFRATYLGGETLQIGEVAFQTVPGFSAFVGGDLMAGVVATEIACGEAYQLLVDLGTNGEMILAKQDCLFGTATAAGPAFEGGSEGGFACDRIKRVIALYEKGYLETNGTAPEEWPKEGILVGDSWVTIEMVQAILVAKAAVRAGIEILLQKAEISAEQVTRIYLAGGFGYYLDVASAEKIGLFPKAFSGKIVAVGNSALAGAKELLGVKSVTELENVAKKATILNLAEEDGFSDIFLAHMGIGDGEENIT